jgi:cystathionine beta-lyase/cystathionine gamma-synthase
VLGGCLVVKSRELLDKLFHVRDILGAVASPFNSWLILRGLRSLPCRMERHCANAAAVAAALAASPAVESVHYPGLSSHPGHDIARRQMRNFGGMLSFLVRGSRSEALRVASRTKRTGQVALANRRLERTKFHQQTVVYPRVQGLYSLYLNNTGKCIKFGYSLGTAERGKLAFFSL